MAKYPCIVLTVHIQVVFQHHLVLGQRTGLVGAENVDSAKILNGVKIFDDGLLFAHGNSALSKAGGHDHGQHLRSQAHGDRDAEEERIQPVALGDAVDEEHQRNHDQHEADQHPGNSVDALGEAGFHRFPRNGGGHGAKQRPVSGADHHGGGTAGHHIAAHKGNVGVIGDALPLRAHIGRFFNRLALTGEARLTDEQILCV